METPTDGLLTKHELDWLLRGTILSERTRGTKTSVRKLIIRTVFARWILFYRIVQRKDIQLYLKGLQKIPLRMQPYLTNITTPEIPETLARMNSGDCGTTAMAVGQTLELLGFDVAYCDLGDHAVIKVDDIYYDALVPDGTKDPRELLSYHGGVEVGTPELIHKRYLFIDELGIDLVQSFARLTSLNYTYPFKFEG